MGNEMLINEDSIIIRGCFCVCICDMAVSRLWMLFFFTDFKCLTHHCVLWQLWSLVPLENWEINWNNSRRTWWLSQDEMVDLFCFVVFQIIKSLLSQILFYSPSVSFVELGKNILIKYCMVLKPMSWKNIILQITCKYTFRLKLISFN